MGANNIKMIARVEEGKGMESVGSVARFSYGPQSNPRQRKTRDVWVVQGNYGQGWEDVTAEETFKEIRQRVKEYRENEPGTAFRVKLTREKIETASNPKRLKYRVMTSFGGKEVSDYHQLATAKRQAKLYAKTTGTPVDVWSTSGGAFGKGKVVAHYAQNPGAAVDRQALLDTLKHLNWVFGKGEIQSMEWTSGSSTGGVRVRLQYGGEFRKFTIKGQYVTFRGHRRKIAMQNPTAGPSAIPTKWTPATVSRKGGQIQIRMGGR
jgi:hypothetical protein